jgi:RimJ/RimL family protein N-acetyltransferase
MKPVTLEGPGVRLEPVAVGHEAGLREASADPSVWTYSPEGKDLAPVEHFARWFARALGQVGSATVLPFTVFQGDLVVGSTRYLNYEPDHRRVEVGNTWYAPSARGTAVNPACKLLLMRHAFEVLRVDRFELKCDARNLASRAAIAKLGAKEEGTLRHHLVLGDGYTRDTVYFSVLRAEWPAVEAGLKARLKIA